MNNVLGMKAVTIIRERLKWSKYRLAKKLGVSQTSLNYLEDEAQSLRIDLLVKLQDLSGMADAPFWKLIKEHVSKSPKTRGRKANE